MSNRPDPAVDRCLVQWVSACLTEKERPVLTLAPNQVPLLLERAHLNRVEGFLYPMVNRLAGVEFSEDQQANLRLVYHHRLVQGFSQLQAGVNLMTALSRVDIPCLGLRGPFTALDAYGDVAARRFFDLDLLVPRSQARQALRIAESAGYQRSTPELPVGFFLRHHLHWQLMHREAGVVTDLHWAIDHPYTLYRINYEEVFAQRETVEHSGLTWQQPGPEHQVMMSCIHLCKHLSAAWAQVQPADALLEICRKGRLSHWLDLAVLLRRYRKTLDPGRLWHLAESWHAVEALASGLDGAALLAPDHVPGGWSHRRSAWLQSGALTPAVVRKPCCAPAAPSRLLLLLARWGGFRASRVADFRVFLKPPDSYFRPSRGTGLLMRRIGHSVVARVRILFAAVDGVACGLWAMVTGINKKRCP